VKLDEGDTVIFSSKQIPGNEVAIGRVMNQLAKRSIRTVTEKQAHIHVSGHPGQPELAKMYGWIKPEMLIPVHGERRHMVEQARFGVKHGIKRVIVQSNGDVVRLAPNGPEIIGKERTGRLLLDGENIVPADGATMGERRRIAQFGVITAAVAISESTGLIVDAEVRMQGIPVEEERDDFIAEMVEAARDVGDKGITDDEKLREALRLGVRRVATDWTGKKPVVDVILLKVR
jgi:ribonuclease J